MRARRVCYPARARNESGGYAGNINVIELIRRGSAGTRGHHRPVRAARIKRTYVRTYVRMRGAGKKSIRGLKPRANSEYRVAVRKRGIERSGSHTRGVLDFSVDSGSFGEFVDGVKLRGDRRISNANGDRWASFVFSSRGIDVIRVTSAIIVPTSIQISVFVSVLRDVWTTFSFYRLHPQFRVTRDTARQRERTSNSRTRNEPSISRRTAIALRRNVALSVRRATGFRDMRLAHYRIRINTRSRRSSAATLLSRPSLHRAVEPRSSAF